MLAFGACIYNVDVVYGNYAGVVDADFDGCGNLNMLAEIGSGLPIKTLLSRRPKDNLESYYQATCYNLAFQAKLRNRLTVAAFVEGMLVTFMHTTSISTVRL
jgi:hypothetical protein